MTAGELQFGGDISVYQSVINYQEKDFWVAKATEGVGFRDVRFTQHWNGSHAAGKVTGAYHFARADLGNSPEAEARWHVSQVPYGPGDFYELDWEIRYGDPVGWCLRNLREVRRLLPFVRSGVYMNQSTMQSFNWTPVANEGYHLWLAAYDRNPGLSLFRWWGWLTFKQYWNAPYDQDSFFGTNDQLRHLSQGGPAPAAQGEEDLMKVVTAANIPVGYTDPHGSGACYATNLVFKRYLASAGELSAALGLAGQSAAQPYDQGSLDRIPEVVPVGFPGSAQLDISALMAAVKELQGGFDIDALAQEISADLAALLPAGSSLSTEAIAAAVGDKLAQRLVS